MPSSQDNNEEKRTIRKGGKVKVSGHQSQNIERQSENKKRKPPTRKEEPVSAPMHLVLTEDEFRARVSQKAFELYETRQAVTEVDDWLEAERLVKKQLLHAGQGAGSV